MATKTKRIPEGYHTITPHLVIRNAAQAIDFYKRAFGAEEIYRSPGPDGKTLMHAALNIGNSRVFLCDEFPEQGAKSPLALGGTPITLHLYVEDVDKIFQKAVQAGAQAVMPVKDQFWGDRYGVLQDPYGHRWSVASHIEDVPPAEMQKRVAEAFKTGCCGS
jgi:PhnB protein